MTFAEGEAANRRNDAWRFIKHLNRLRRSGDLDEMLAAASNAVLPDLTLEEREEHFQKAQQLLGE